MATLYQKSDLKNSPQNDSRKETYVVLLQSASTALERLKSFAFISEESSSLFTQLELLATCRSSIDSMENILRQKQNCPDSNSHIEGRPINLFSGDASGAADGGSSRTISLTQPPTSRSKPPPPAPPVNAQNERSTTQQIPTSANSSFRGMPVRLSDSATSQGQESSIGQPSHSRQNSDPKSAANLLHDALFLADPREVIDTSRSLTPSTVFRPWASPDIPPSPLLLQYRELNRILYESTGGNGMGGGDMSIASMMSNIANTPSGKSEGDEISILSVSTTVTGSTSTRHRAIAEGSPIRHRLARVIYQILLAASSATVTSFRPANVAFELCRIDKDIFDRIRPEDIAKHRPPTNPSPSVHSSTEFFNYLTRLVEFTILEPLDPADRAFAIYIWVKIAWNLYQMRNLQSLKAIVSALGTPPVARLKRTWPLVQKKTMSMLDELKLLLSEQNNYSAYREWIVKSGTRPMVPFLGVYMHDITYLLALAKKDGSAAVATATERRIRDIFEEIEYYQNGPKFASDQFATMLRSEKKTGALNFKNKSSFKSGISSRAPPELQPIRDADEETVSQFVQHWILSRKWFTEKEMDALSLVREPRHLVDPGTPSGGVGLSTVSGTGHSQQSQPLGSSSATASGGPQSSSIAQQQNQPHGMHSASSSLPKQSHEIYFQQQQIWQQQQQAKDNAASVTNAVVVEDVMSEPISDFGGSGYDYLAANNIAVPPDFFGGTGANLMTDLKQNRKRGSSLLESFKGSAFLFGGSKKGVASAPSTPTSASFASNNPLQMHPLVPQQPRNSQAVSTARSSDPYMAAVQEDDFERRSLGSNTSSECSLASLKSTEIGDDAEARFGAKGAGLGSGGMYPSHSHSRERSESSTGGGGGGDGALGKSPKTHSSDNWLLHGGHPPGGKQSLPRQTSHVSPGLLPGPNGPGDLPSSLHLPSPMPESPTMTSANGGKRQARGPGSLLSGLNAASGSASFSSLNSLANGNQSSNQFVATSRSALNGSNSALNLLGTHLASATVPVRNIPRASQSYVVPSAPAQNMRAPPPPSQQQQHQPIPEQSQQPQTSQPSKHSHKLPPPPPPASALARAAHRRTQSTPHAAAPPGRAAIPGGAEGPAGSSNQAAGGGYPGSIPPPPRRESRHISEPTPTASTALMSGGNIHDRNESTHFMSSDMPQASPFLLANPSLLESDPFTDYTPPSPSPFQESIVTGEPFSNLFQNADSTGTGRDRAQSQPAQSAGQQPARRGPPNYKPSPPPPIPQATFTNQAMHSTFSEASPQTPISSHDFELRQGASTNQQQPGFINFGMIPPQQRLSQQNPPPVFRAQAHHPEHSQHQQPAYSKPGPHSFGILPHQHPTELHAAHNQTYHSTELLPASTPSPFLTTHSSPAISVTFPVTFTNSSEDVSRRQQQVAGDSRETGPAGRYTWAPNPTSGFSVNTGTHATRPTPRPQQQQQPQPQSPIRHTPPNPSVSQPNNAFLPAAATASSNPSANAYFSMYPSAVHQHNNNKPVIPPKPAKR